MPDTRNLDSKNSNLNPKTQSRCIHPIENQPFDWGMVFIVAASVIPRYLHSVCNLLQLSHLIPRNPHTLVAASIFPRDPHTRSRTNHSTGVWSSSSPRRSNLIPRNPNTLNPGPQNQKKKIEPQIPNNKP